ncbi:MAG: exodeoxyribonuclease VII small subunit [candidate division Zixibacteria bacterium]|nr:exodeoxyribonuclease VII small subunit [candidate division Zixibacteria bacterium]
MNFEKGLSRLEEIVEQLESGDLPLDQSLKIFQEGIELFRFCTQKLNDAQKKVEKLVELSDGKFKLEPFDFKEEE